MNIDIGTADPTRRAELSDLVAEPLVFISTAGETLAIEPLKVRQLQPFLRAVTPALSSARLVDGVLDVMPLVAAHGDELMQAAAVATGKAVTWVGDLPADDFVRLVAAVIEVNGDFFVRRLGPAIEQAAQALTQRLGARPVTPSAGST